MDRVYVISHKWHNEGLSIRQIARDLGVSRNTVRKYVGDEEEPRGRASPRRPRPVLDGVSGRIDEILQEWSARTTAKQRITGTRGMTVAAIDRLVHRASIFELNVDSYRRRTAIERGRATVDGTG